MHKIRAIALREYLAAVKAKAFLITIMLMPVLMGGSIGLQILFQKLDSDKEKKYAVIDHTPGQTLSKFLHQRMALMQQARQMDPELRGLLSAKTSFVEIEARSGGPEALVQQRFEISKQIERGEFEALVEIGPEVISTQPSAMFLNPDKVDDKAAVRMQSKGTGAMQFRRILEVLINQGVQQERFKKKGLGPEELALLQLPVAVKLKSLTRLDDKTGAMVDEPDATRIVNLILPGALIGLMFMVIMIGATPAMHGIIEEKSQRIAEVLLGSVTPFQLMAGKLLGIIGVALTMSLVYLGGGYFTVSYFGYADMMPVHVLVWFVPMLVMALMIFGSLFIAVGAAAADIKDTQTLMMPIMMFACIPMFALGPIMQDPNGPIARVCTFFPFATPMILVARESVPPGVPWWEMLAGITLVLATTLVCVWAAGRIFRVGILMQGKGPKFTDLIRWAIRG